MSADPYADILKKFDGLSDDQKRQLLEKLHAQATKTGDVKSDRTLFDAFNDDGMMGSITDAPSDWRTNPEYMKGFGEDG